MIISLNCFDLHKKIFFIAIGVIIISIFPSITKAQDSAEKGLPFVTNFHPNEFHSYPQNWAITEDNRGLMYFGNQGYILEYDGVKWEKIPVAETGTIAIRSLTKNKKGIIYYGSISDFGFLSVDSLGQTKANSALKYVPPSLRNFNDVWTDYATDEGVYFQSRERIFRFAESKTGGGLTGEIKSWEPKSKFMYSFFLDGILYVHQQQLGLFKLINDSLQKIPGSEFLGNERLQVMLPYPSDNSEKKYLLGMFYSGLYLFDGKTFSRFHTDADSLLKYTLYKGAVLNDGSFALATAGRGLVIINKNGKILQVINRESGLQDESVYGVYSDQKNNLWLALDNGISRVQSSSPLTQFTIQSGITTAVLAATRFNGVLYLGSTNGLLRFNRNKRIFEHLNEVSTNQIFAFLKTDDEMLVATDGLYSIKNNKIILVKPSLSGNLQIASLFRPKKCPNLVLAGDAIHGLAFFKRKDKKEKDSSEWKFNRYIPGDIQQAWTMAEDKEGTVWLGTQTETVYRLKIFLDSAGDIDFKRTIPEKFGVKDGLGSGCGLVSSANGIVYFSADSGLYTFNNSTSRFIKDSTFGNFPNAGGKDESALVEDSSGKVWIRLGKESIIATPQPDKSYKIDANPLIPINERTINAIYPEKNGITWISTTDGLVRYDENKEKKYDLPFQALLRKIDAGNELLSPGDGDSSTENISIPYKNNNLRFEYAAPFFEQEDKIKYQTWMEGFDKSWTDWGNNSYKEYTNLSDRKYRFHVRAKNVFRNISTEAIYNFTIESPPMRTWWAYLLYILAAVLLIYFFIRYRTRKLHSQRIELEKKIQERTHEVQVQAEELMTINQISQALASQLELNDLIKLVGDEMRQVFKADIVYLALLDKKNNIINFPYQYGEALPPMKYGEGIASRIISSGKPLLLNNNLNEQISQLGIQRMGLPSASYLGVPIPIDDEISGVLSVQSTRNENYFDEKDQRLLSTIAANVGVALKKARLFEEVKHAKLEAEQSSKNAERANEAKSAFLSTVSHELRTPLTSVLGFAKIIKKRLEERIFPVTVKTDPKTEKAIGQVSENLNVVISEGERLTHLINDVLDLAKIEAGKMEWNMEKISIPEIIDRAIAATSSLFYQKNIVLEKFVAKDLPETSGDQDKLIQVVVNLISNAVKFTEQGSVACSAMSNGKEIITSVKDSGIGISKNDFAAVFEQFKQVGGDTLTDKPKGTGLGLPISKEIVEHHGGRIWLESEPGKGSTFFFSLPIVRSAIVSNPIHLDELVKQLKAQMAHSKLTTAKDGNATILIVDDDDSIRSLLRQEFGDVGYLVEEATNGKEALAAVRNHRPDLILLDVMMPEMNGFDVAAILKNDPQTMDIPIIILSIVQDKARGYRIGVDRYLTKPIDTGKLFAEVGTLLEQGKSKRKVMVVDEDSATVKTLSEVLQAKGYMVFESDGKELVEKAINSQPDIIILNSVFSGKQEIVQTLRFEKGLENVLFLIYQ
jgi:signal transduction histidine kinase/CheY-like chemotaxis protein